MIENQTESSENKEDKENPLINSNIIRSSTSTSAYVHLESPDGKYLDKTNQYIFIFETNTPLKYIFWIFLVFSVLGSVALFFIKLEYYIRFIFIGLFFIITFILSVLHFAIKIEINTEKETMLIKGVSRLRLFDGCRAIKHSILEITEFKMCFNVINPRFIEYSLEFSLQNGEKFTLFEKWGLSTEREEFENIVKNLNIFVRNSKEDVRSNRETLRNNNYENA